MQDFEIVIDWTQADDSENAPRFITVTGLERICDDKRLRLHDHPCIDIDRPIHLSDRFFRDIDRVRAEVHLIRNHSFLGRSTIATSRDVAIQTDMNDVSTQTPEIKALTPVDTRMHTDKHIAIMYLHIFLRTYGSRLQKSAVNLLHLTWHN